MKGKYPEVDEGLLHFVTKIYVKGQPIKHREMELKEGKKLPHLSEKVKEILKQTDQYN